MRVFIKGGVWKNTEDEILKAAVMKYGKNMWARIASLLPRKSAKQVKARWYEWLDPSIKKTEWTRDEEERLLHLAKLMPMQWRTIAPIVGRTAEQCLEHYEKLLNQAQDPDGKLDDKDDPRRLRPGEIDPHPETKPARPDPVDMDEDEKEMLSEARARLANTRGKKAKRKAREKQLEEARRLTALQKRRELKSAGINSRLRKRKRGEIDYVKEIPFQKVAPAGFYNTSADDDRMSRLRRDARFIGKNIAEVEGERRAKTEKKEREKDKRRMEKLSKTNLPRAIEIENKLNDPLSFKKRSRLSMPAPQVSDRELEDIVKYGTAGAAGEGTTALVGQYATPTPMRTPRTPSNTNTLMDEARNLIALNAGETPLKGGDNPELAAGTGFDGVTPARSVAATPSTMVGGVTPGATPMRGGATPMRDELSINQDAQSWVSGAPSNLAERRRQKQLRKELASSLSNLPTPEYELDIVVPEVEGKESDFEMTPLSVDASESSEAAAAARQAAQERELRRRSSALKRDPPLPRPLVVKREAIVDSAGLDDEDLAQAHRLVQEEVYALMARDAVKFPLGKSRKRKAPALENYSQAELKAARDTLSNEEVGVRIISETEGAGEMDVETLTPVWEAMLKDLVFLPNEKRYIHRSEATNEQIVGSFQFKYNTLQALLGKLSKRATKLEAKVSVLTGGYNKRATLLSQQVVGTYQQLTDSTLELACFRRLGRDEESALPGRLAAAQAEAQDVAEREAELQARYRDLTVEREQLLAKLSA